MNNSIVLGSIQDMATTTGRSLAECMVNVDVIVFVDVSGSMEDQDAPGGRSRYEAACEELANIQRQHPGRVAVIAFSNNVVFCASGVPAFEGRFTAMDNALEFGRIADGAGIQFILLSDGLPDSPRETLRIAEMYETPIDTVYMGPESGPEADEGRRFLAELSRITHGRSVTTAQPAMIEQPILALMGSNEQET